MTNNNSPSTYGDYSDQMADELDEYGVWVKSGPQSLEDPPVALPEPSHNAAPATTEGNGFPSDLLKDFLTDIEDSGEADEIGQETDVPDVPVIVPVAATPSRTPISETLELEAALPMDSEAANTEKAAIMESQDTHTDLLNRIADELASIHGELAGIRQELELSRIAAATATATAAPAPEAPKSNDMALIRDELNGIREELRRRDELALIHDELTDIRQELNRPAAALAPEPVARDDFFDDDDEKIVLTGDELSNIFNTANLVPQDGENAPDESPDTEDTPPKHTPPDERQLDKSLLNEISLDETLPDIGAEYLNVVEEADTEELQELREKGAQPLTPAPEDTSYLDLPSFDAPTLDLSNAVIDEIDIPVDIDEQPLEEPVFEDIANLSLDEITTAVVTDMDADADEEHDDDHSLDETATAVVTDMDADADEEHDDDHSLDEITTAVAADMGVGEEHDDSHSLGETATAVAADMGVGEEHDDESLIDDLLIDSSSMKDIEIELEDIDELEEDDDELFGLDDEDDDDDDLAVLLSAIDWEDSVEAEIADSPKPAVPKPAPEPIKEPEEEVVPELAIEVQEEPYGNVSSYLTRELKHILTYMDQILDSLPNDKITAFTESKHFDIYRRILSTLGLP
jgi:hypothetical protein